MSRYKKLIGLFVCAFILLALLEMYYFARRDPVQVGDCVGVYYWDCTIQSRKLWTPPFLARRVKICGSTDDTATIVQIRENNAMICWKFQGSDESYGYAELPVNRLRRIK